jgi:hypothetical protein
MHQMRGLHTARNDAAAPVPATNAERADTDDTHSPAEKQDIKNGKSEEQLLNIRQNNTR